MISLDMTFCENARECAKGNKCERKITEEERRAAFQNGIMLWWGDFKECFELKKAETTDCGRNKARRVQVGENPRGQTSSAVGALRGEYLDSH